jgi:hypothetical protein
MKMTANLPKTQVLEKRFSKNNSERIAKIISTKWQLTSIYETGLITDEAKFTNVDVVFSQFYIYALFGNRVDKYKYKFISNSLFTVNIEGVDVKCRIKEFSDNVFVFHADFNNSYFIIELATAL